MATLNDDTKAFIVQALACYDTPSQVVDAVQEEFGIQVSRPQVQAYDPTKAQGKALSKKWRDLFEATRARFLKEAAEIPIATQSFRLRALQKLYEKTASRGNVVVAAQLIEQAAKEAGGVFTNKQRVEHTGKDGAPIEQRTAVVNEHEVRAAVDKLESEY